MQVFVLEIESGSSEQSGAMIFDSVWYNLEDAEAYAQKFRDDRWPYSITETFVQ
jgi:hypothetical protein